ncbi:MAG: DUF5624 domain-containing protein [Myxococcota bacterium]|nr:DUF5624 domain-containing protein [Myxococcota bacterium]
MTDYTTHQAFADLYFDFTGYQHANYPAGRRAIAKDLAQALSNNLTKLSAGPLVIATKTGIYAYDSDPGHRLLRGTSFRAAPNSGFYEITSLSHVGPAIAYLATLRTLGSENWRDHIPPMLTHLQQVREVNRAGLEEHWLTQLACTAWVGRETRIKRMIDYACGLASHYLMKIKEDPEKLSEKHLRENFLESSSADFPIGYNTVMIGTFACEALRGAHLIHSCLKSPEIDWKSAKVLLCNLAGVNYGAGLTASSNWLYPTVLSIAGDVLDPRRVIIAPYSPIPEAVGEDALNDEDFDQLASSTWGALYSRPVVTQSAFPFVEDIVVAPRDPIPGDYGFTGADDIDHFIRRLKFSTGNPKEMLSNTVGFWIAGEAVAKGWDLTKMDIPGLTHGFPDGLDDYPTTAPEISHS